ncbi:hypothetical protein EVAR_68615_1 [Eumeta japonica]|uniref:BTB domain-containing protein n=1 Tax=Eumeta variegata TaxID=151549 RepID=A0A4C1ZPW2_EUMVA|nr:hypothetical protein EVAR_68615_1 [Eumeta japonica]
MSDYSEITFHANEDWIFKSAKYSLSSENVANNFKIFRQDGTLCDVDLVSGDTVVKAHRVVLAAACVYFETMFKSGLEEWNRKSVPLPSIAPMDGRGQTMISGSTVIHLVDAANMLQLQELSVGCAQYLRKQLHPSNVVGIIRLAETHNLVQLAEEALSYAESLGSCGGWRGVCASIVDDVDEVADVRRARDSEVQFRSSQYSRKPVALVEER